MKKYSKIIIIIILIAVIVSGYILLKMPNKETKNNVPKENIYDEIVKSFENKDTNALIYYYDSSTNNSVNDEIKDYLNSLKISYSIYDHAKIDKKEYRQVLAKLNIDENVFGMPAIIYMHEGIMYANIINIDKVDTVKRFIETYKLNGTLEDDSTCDTEDDTEE